MRSMLTARVHAIAPRKRHELHRVLIRFCIAVPLATFAAAAAHADKIEQYVTRRMSHQHIPALSLAVVKNGKAVKVKGYGWANLELAVQATPQTVFQIGSMSKQFIATAIMQLSNEGKLGLDDSVNKYLEDAPETWRP